MNIKTVEMHTNGDPVRLVTGGCPEIKGKDVLEKMKFFKNNLDHIRRLLILEPRGHVDMYGAVLVEPDHPEAHIAAFFIHSSGYGTMCGHATIAIARYAVDHGFVSDVQEPETAVNVQCPCGLVRAYVEYKNGKTGSSRIHTVPAFVFATDFEIEVVGYGKLKVDISYGGAFYAYVSADVFGLDMRTSPVRHIIAAAGALNRALVKQVKVEHPDNDDLSFICGTVMSDGKDVYDDGPTVNVMICGDSQVSRSPCGSGTTGRIALLYHKGLLTVDQPREFQNLIGCNFIGKVVRPTTCGKFDAAIVELKGRGYYAGSANFTVEEDDPLKDGFLID
ncbi:trans-L-3-hydroxyproline dehydratase-like [Saccoglossus kowalevskii]|uniref:trans-L-3-hydroxyproline dehydratase n=1 Tax=Saccoglossus kowalevskii TaxID=10224 RepID=A0ABM0GP09_SACKO|nr:PREDICTED: trans-L-3-hydroxyproline dehydratase-like [Saccoglossus kowalevskii]